MASYTNASWAQQVLSDLGVSTTGNNFIFMMEWMASENSPHTWTGTAGANNPLNNGYGSGGGAGLGSYPDLTIAAQDVAANLLAGNYGYGAIVSALRANADPSVTARATWNSGWASGHYDYGAKWAGSVPTIYTQDQSASNGATSGVAGGSGATSGGGPLAQFSGMTPDQVRALAQAAAQPGGAAFLTAAAEQAANAQATGSSGAPTSGTIGNAMAVINSTLSLLGPAFANDTGFKNWVFGEVTSLAAKGMDATDIGNQVGIDIQSQPIFAQYYPGIVARRQQGKPPMSVADYQAYTEAVQSAAADAGLPRGMFDTSTPMGRMAIGNLVQNEVSPAEVSQRIKQGYEVAAYSDPNLVRELATYFPQIFPQGLPMQAPTGGPPMTQADWQALAAAAKQPGGTAYLQAMAKTQPTSTGMVQEGNYKQTGGTLGALAAYWLDPNRAYDLMINQLTQAQIGAEGLNTGFGQISAGEAAQLQGAGFTQAEARSNFSKINKLVPMESQLPGVPGSSMSQTDLVNYGFYGANQQELETVQGVRKAPFSGGGGYAQTARGAVGVGYASTEGIQGT